MGMTCPIIVLIFRAYDENSMLAYSLEFLVVLHFYISSTEKGWSFSYFLTASIRRVYTLVIVLPLCHYL